MIQLFLFLMIDSQKMNLTFALVRLSEKWFLLPKRLSGEIAVNQSCLEIPSKSMQSW
jgi:hypothetical protein